MTPRNPYAFHVRPDMRQGLASETPLPTRLVSNEEFPPLPQTRSQRRVEDRILAEAARLAPRLGLSRRDFLRSSGGMAASLLAMNAVFGRFFDVLPVEAAEPAAFKERKGDAFFIFDVQLHYVGAGYDPSNEEAARKGVTKTALLGLRQNSRRLNPKLAADQGTLADLAWSNMVKEVFFDSETDIGLISTPPGPYPQEAVVPPKEMTHFRDEINRVTQSRRMLAHGLITPQLGQVDLDFMDQQAATLKVDAWKGYTGAAPKGFDRGWAHAMPIGGRPSASVWAPQTGATVRCRSGATSAIGIRRWAGRRTARSIERSMPTWPSTSSASGSAHTERTVSAAMSASRSVRACSR